MMRSNSSRSFWTRVAGPAIAGLIAGFASNIPYYFGDTPISSLPASFWILNVVSFGLLTYAFADWIMALGSVRTPAGGLVLITLALIALLLKQPFQQTWTGSSVLNFGLYLYVIALGVVEVAVAIQRKRSKGRTESQFTKQEQH